MQKPHHHRGCPPPVHHQKADEIIVDGPRRHPGARHPHSASGRTTASTANCTKRSLHACNPDTVQTAKAFLLWKAFVFLPVVLCSRKNFHKPVAFPVVLWYNFSKENTRKEGIQDEPRTNRTSVLCPCLCMDYLYGNQTQGPSNRPRRLSVDSADFCRTASGFSLLSDSGWGKNTPLP